VSESEWLLVKRSDEDDANDDSDDDNDDKDDDERE
jgi:hypothetical protein